ncbi:sodium/proton-translocating pyrophosphatase [Aggregatilinea lenta]|uniref:sodium/proton-translocating pyrophosphatase n=1 Tax=Aggregatilinea lenta TaxID=913108 RepID=UPI0013C37969|nr:sodium/proton-translocating pyrophosphatase [Aggregatilinea lenta]
MSEDSDRTNMPPESPLPGNPPPPPRTQPPAGQPPTGTPPPVGQYPPPPGQRQEPVQGAPASARPQVTPLRPAGSNTNSRPQAAQVDEVRRKATAALVEAGIDVPVAIQTLIIAAVGGLLAALLDEILGLPTGALWFTFGWIVAAFSGATYAMVKNAKGLPAAIMSLVAGIVAFLLYFILTEIIGDEYGWTYSLNVFKAIITGAIVGLIGFGWFALMKWLPAKLPRIG